jgi:uncharacterized membrane protein
MGRVITLVGIAIVALGWAFGSNCDFDTMAVCRPLELFAGDAFSVSGYSGLLMAAGFLLILLGVVAAFWRVLRKTS